MLTTKALTKIEMEKARAKADRLELQLKTMKDEPSIKDCPRCETKNYHYYADSDSWCCAYC